VIFNFRNGYGPTISLYIRFWELTQRDITNVVQRLCEGFLWCWYSGSNNLRFIGIKETLPRNKGRYRRHQRWLRKCGGCVRVSRGKDDEQ
ncbi:hypothetical protein A2U01_0003782, partial [Trifolium medium]|nr:hypothetical protein [Trifolium medium]